MHIRGCVALIALLIAGNAAFAQTESGGVEQSLNKKNEPSDRLSKEAPQINVENKPELSSSGHTVKVQVSKFTITGSTAYSADSLHSFVAEGEGKELTLDEIKALADRITRYYRRRGYGAAWAYIPAQTIKNGEVEIAVVEAKVDKVLVAGNEHYASSFILGHMTSLIKQETLDLDTLENSLYNLNDYPGLSVTATLRPGDGAGTTDVYLQAQDKFPVLASMDYDNFGAEFIGTTRLGTTIQILNIGELAHYLTFRAVEGIGPGGLEFIRLGYTIPFSWGPKINLYGSTYKFNVEGDLSNLSPTGSGDVFGFTVSYPLVRNHVYSIVPEFGFEYKNLEQKLLGAVTSQDKLRVMVANVQLEWNDDFMGRWTGALQYRKGMPGYLGGLEANDPDASRFGGGGDFSKWGLLIYRLQRVAWWVHFIGKFQYQKSDDLLVVSEQLAIGGSDSVRGYPPFEVLGDSGYAWTIEARLKIPLLEGYPVMDMLQFAAFYDSGQIERNNSFLGSTPKETRSGAGFGLRFLEPRWGSIRFDVGWPTTPEDPSTGHTPIFYINAIVNLN